MFSRLRDRIVEKWTGGKFVTTDEYLLTWMRGSCYPWSDSRYFEKNIDAVKYISILRRTCKSTNRALRNRPDLAEYVFDFGLAKVSRRQLVLSKQP